jgi:hypothetical protein
MKEKVIHRGDAEYTKKKRRDGRITDGVKPLR